MMVIANTTILSNFAGLEQLSLLHFLWERVYIAEQVYAEVQEGVRAGYAFYEGIDSLIYPWANQGWLHLTGLQTDEELRLFGQLLGRLHEGEAACLALASSRGWLFLSDDKAARTAARRIQIPVAGTIGVLPALVRERHLTVAAADRLLSEMQQRGYFSPMRSLSELLG